MRSMTRRCFTSPTRLRPWRRSKEKQQLAKATFVTEISALLDLFYSEGGDAAGCDWCGEERHSEGDGGGPGQEPQTRGDTEEKTHRKSLTKKC